MCEHIVIGFVFKVILIRKFSFSKPTQNTKKGMSIIMKKYVGAFLLAVICISMLSACGAKETEVKGELSTRAEVSSSQPATVEMDNTAEDKGEEISSEAITFETEDIKGNVVTSDIFKDYDITMINVWGTGCVPCIEEMPGLAKFYDNLADNVNMVSICVDYEADPQFAEDVLSQSGANFATLKVSDSLFQSVLTKAQALPTTIFVDKDGNIVGEVILGAPELKDADQVVEHYNNYLEERLGELGGA